ncbi:MAG: hypothetical protein O7F71_20495 [Gammaproteobacteria bacterium]|nr:hypothetical protein [Gammaproteobacteria bacterium]
MRVIKTICICWLFVGSVANAAEHHYRLSLDETLDHISIEARLAPGFSVLTARNGDTEKLASLTDCNGERVRTRRSSIRLTTDQSCVRYEYPLRVRGRQQRVKLAADVLITSPSEWLWIPTLEEGDRVLIELDTPETLHVSTPWQTIDSGAFVLHPSPQSSRSNVILGNFRERTIPLPQAELRVALLDGLTKPLNEDKILSWLDAAAQDVAGVYGRFPNPSLQVIVIPSGPGRRGGSGSPVPFGHVIRDGGEAVRFFVNADKSLDDYLGDWTATHEFAHLLLPYIESSQKWISEGFASYYQNVLLARRGVYSEEDAWRRLNRSFNRANEIDDPPSPNDTGDHPFWEVRMLVYWSGAAIALLADVELREMSHGKESLDTVLGRLQSCCLPSQRQWGGREFFFKLDELSKTKVFSRLYEEHADSSGMPDLAELCRRLGIKPVGDRVQLLDNAPLVDIRRSIMGQKGS